VPNIRLQSLFILLHLSSNVAFLQDSSSTTTSYLIQIVSMGWHVNAMSWTLSFVPHLEGHVVRK